MKSELETLLQGIDCSTVLEPGQIAVSKLESWPNHFIGRTSSHLPCLLIVTADQEMRAPIRLAGLEVGYSIRCSLRMDEFIADAVLTLITCKETNRANQSYFLLIMEALLNAVGDRPTVATASEAIEIVADILQQLDAPSKKTVLGCYSEVLLIEMSRNPAVATQAWRNDPNGRVDFATGKARIEVKASSVRTRVHYFSAEQCIPPPGTVVVVASMFVECSGSGTTLKALLHRLEQKLDGNWSLMLKIRRVVAETLGRDAPAAMVVEFDEFLARSSLRFYDIAGVPAIRTIPSGVSAVRFRSDLSNQSPISNSEILALCTGFAGLLPDGG